MPTKFVLAVTLILSFNVFAESAECGKCDRAQRSGLAICAANPEFGEGGFYSEEDRQTAITLKRAFQFARDSFKHSEKLPEGTSIAVRSYAARDGSLKNQDAFETAANECSRARKVAEQVCDQQCPCIVCEALAKKEAGYRNDAADWGKIAADYSKSSMSDDDAKAREAARVQEISQAYDEATQGIRGVASSKKLYGPYHPSPNVEDRTKP